MPTQERKVRRFRYHTPLLILTYSGYLTLEAVWSTGRSPKTIARQPLQAGSIPTSAFPSLVIVNRLHPRCTFVSTALGRVLVTTLTSPHPSG